MKSCRICRLLKPTAEFFKCAESADGFGYVCRSCNKEEQAKYRRDHPDRVNAYKRKEHHTLRDKVFGLLGSFCWKCGFTDRRALCFDHVFGYGNLDKKLGPRQLYRKILLHPTFFQVLCANCNLIKAIEENELNSKKYKGLDSPGQTSSKDPDLWAFGER